MDAVNSVNDERKVSTVSQIVVEMYCLCTSPLILSVEELYELPTLSPDTTATASYQLYKQVDGRQDLLYDGSLLYFARRKFPISSEKTLNC